MRRHTYVANKGYAEEYKGRQISWDVPESVEEAISSGAFEDAATLVKYAVAQLNIKKGHAVQAATIEQTTGEDGKPTGVLANPNMTTAQMEALAASVVAKKSERTRGAVGGAAKDRAKKFDTAATKAKEIAANASPEKLATLLELGLMTQDEHDAALAKIQPSKRSR